MFGNKLKTSFILFIMTIIVGCGTTPQPPVALNSSIFTNAKTKVGILYSAPEGGATTHIYGAGCLLCYGVASSLTSSLDKHLKKSISDDELNNIKQLVMNEYQEKTHEIKFVQLPTPLKKLPKFKGELGFAKKDFRSLKSTLGVDILVVLDIHNHGAYRSFSNYIPNGDPQGFISGLLYSVDLDSNAYAHYMVINETVQPVGEWDEPPLFPSVTTSYYQAIENLKDKIKASI